MVVCLMAINNEENEILYGGIIAWLRIKSKMDEKMIYIFIINY